MQRPIRPDWLIRQAKELGGAAAGVGQPRNADLRRAVSDAYYALFHFIVLACVESLMPTCPEEDRLRMARHFQHTAIKKVCDWVVGPSNPPDRVRHSLLQVRADGPLRDVALAFVTLQERRHDADYNHLTGLSRPETLTLIQSAEDAMQKLAAAKGSQNYERLMAHIALKTAISS